MPKRNQYFITISKYNRGSLSMNEIDEIHQFFLNQPYEQLFIVNEHYNKKRERYEHIHLFIRLHEHVDHDYYRKTIKKSISFLEHQKDLDVHHAYDEKRVLAGYMLKADDTSIIERAGFTQEQLDEIEILSQSYKEEQAKSARNKSADAESLFKARISPLDLPYVIKNYIKEKDIKYFGLIQDFTQILYSMLRDGYDFQLKNMKEVKAKLDIIELDNMDTLCAVMQMEFQFLPALDERWNTSNKIPMKKSDYVETIDKYECKTDYWDTFSDRNYINKDEINIV